MIHERRAEKAGSSAPFPQAVRGVVRLGRGGVPLGERADRVPAHPMRSQAGKGQGCGRGRRIMTKGSFCGGSPFFGGTIRESPLLSNSSYVTKRIHLISNHIPAGRSAPLGFAPNGTNAPCFLRKTSTPPRDSLRFPILTPFSAAPLRMTVQGKERQKRYA